MIMKQEQLSIVTVRSMRMLIGTESFSFGAILLYMPTYFVFICEKHVVGMPVAQNILSSKAKNLKTNQNCYEKKSNELGRLVIT